MKKKFDIEGKKQFNFDVSKAAAQIDGSIIIEGYVSTPDLDAGMDIVEPKAFTPEVLAKYKEKPIVLFMHNYHDLPVGKALALRVDEHKGLWASIQLLPTESMGKDVIMLVKAGVINSFSYTYRVKKYSIDEEKGIRTINEFESISEISVVNLGMNFEAVFTEAAALDLELQCNEFKSIMHNKSVQIKKGNNMSLTPEEIKKLQDEAAASKTAAEAATVKVGEVRKEIDDVNQLLATMKSAHERELKTAGETKAYVEKIGTDVKSAIDAQTKEIQRLTESKIPYGGSNEIPFEVKDLLSMPAAQFKSLFSAEKAGQIDALQRKHDQVILVDGIMCAQSKHAGTGYFTAPRKVRMNNLKCHKEYEMMSKAAFDTAGSDEGAEYLETGYSARMTAMVRQALVIAPMHPTFPMIASIQVLPVEGADTLATRVTQRGTLVSGFDAVSQTPGSANKTYTAEKLRGRTQYSGEADEDLIISVIDYIEGKVSNSIARSIDWAMLSGDDAGGTGLDSGDTPGATDARYCWNGFRVDTLAASKVDLSTFSETNLNLLRSKGGKYFANPDDFYQLMSIVGFLLHVLDPDEMPSFRTIDKYGPNATVVAGTLGKINGSDVRTSEFVLDTYDPTGIYAAAGNDRSILQMVHKSSYMLGLWRTIQMEIVRNPYYDVYDIIAYWRGDFKNMFDPTAEPVTATGFGVVTA